MTPPTGAVQITCPDCRDTLVPGRVDHSSLLTNGPMIVEHVPAFVCPQCGYSAIPAQTWEVLEQLAAGCAAPVRFATVPVYDLSELPDAGIQIPRRPQAT